jgi:hypothetical protein
LVWWLCVFSLCETGIKLRISTEVDLSTVLDANVGSEPVHEGVAYGRVPTSTNAFLVKAAGIRSGGSGTITVLSLGTTTTNHIIVP